MKRTTSTGRFLASAVSALVFVCLSGCDGLTKSLVPTLCETPGGGLVPVDARQAYQDNMMPVLMNNCQTCHRVGGVAPSAFADPGKSVDELYQLARQRANFVSLGDSLLYQRGTDGHCQGCQVARESGSMLTALERWSEGESSFVSGASSCGPETVVSGTNRAFQYSPLVTIPANLGTAFVSMSFALDSIGQPGARATLEIRRYTTRDTTGPGSYEVRNLQLISGIGVNIKGASPRVVGGGGQFASVDWANLVSNSPASTTGFLLTGRSTILVQQADTGDQLQIGFSTIQTAAPCRELPNFVQNVVPIISARCATCHTGAGNPAATARMNLPNDDAGRCNILIQRASFPGLFAQPVVRPTENTTPIGRARHPNVNGYSTIEKQMMANWIDREFGGALSSPGPTSPTPPP